jgi:hypothetical protein
LGQEEASTVRAGAFVRQATTTPSKSETSDRIKAEVEDRGRGATEASPASHRGSRPAGSAGRLAHGGPVRAETVSQSLISTFPQADLNITVPC